MAHESLVAGYQSFKGVRMLLWFVAWGIASACTPRTLHAADGLTKQPVNVDERRTFPPLTPPPPAVAAGAALELITTDTHEATALVAAPGLVGQMFLVQKAGLIRVLRGRTFDAKPFLDLRRKVKLEKRDNGEQGLLGLAFHPAFDRTRFFYINYTDLEGTTQVEEWQAAADGGPPVRKRRTLLSVPQPHANHNAGDLAFGPDGRLYLGLGDGGSSNDPHGHGQNPETLLSQLLRLDVAQENPRAETLGLGLRNPWRISFDRTTGDLYIADVGQSRYEYVHVVTAARLQSGARLNFGWSVMEGSHCFQDKPCDPSQYDLPYIEYDRKSGCSVTGGYVYRGKALPRLVGQYFYSDYCTALLRSFALAPDGDRAANSWDWKPLLDPHARLARIASFGEDHDGELYIVTHEGPIYKLVATQP